MTNFAIALTSLITPWTATVVCLILLGISTYYCAVDKKARDRAEREREDEAAARQREKVQRLDYLADIARQRTRDTERRMRAADRDGAAMLRNPTETRGAGVTARFTPKKPDGDAA